MTTLGYSLPPHTGQLQHLQMGAVLDDRPAPLMSQSLYSSRDGTRAEYTQQSGQRRGGSRLVRGEGEDGIDLVERRRGREGRRAEAATAGGRSGGSREKGKGERGGRVRGKREEAESLDERREEVLEREGEEVRRVGRGLLSLSEDEELKERHSEPGVEVSYPGSSNVQHSYNPNSHHLDTLRKEDKFILQGADMMETSDLHQQRHPRSILSPTLQPPLSTLSLLYQFGAGEEHTLLSQPIPLSLQRGTSLLSPPLAPLLSSTSPSYSSSSPSLLSVRPMMNDFARKVEGFWILRELQSWLWRSAKDFNRLKRRLRG